MKTQLIILTTVSLFTLLSCKKTEEQCNDINEGSFTYTQKSLGSIPYFGKTAVVFKDSLDQEITFLVEDEGDELIHWSFPGYCETNYYDTIQHKFEVQKRTIVLNNDSIEFTFRVGILTLLDGHYFNEYDKLVIEHSMNSAYWQSFEIIADQRKVRDAQAKEIDYSVKYEQEFSIFNTTFIDVYHTSFIGMNDPFKLYYNKEFGVVSFKDNSGKRWIFEKFM